MVQPGPLVSHSNRETQRGGKRPSSSRRQSRGGGLRPVSDEGVTGGDGDDAGKHSHHQAHPLVPMAWPAVACGPLAAGAADTAAARTDNEEVWKHQEAHVDPTTASIRAEMA
jgi:hypothetical protein